MNRMRWGRVVWLVLTAAALLWPAHLLSPLDGVPLDRPLEAIVVGLLLPALIFMAPSFVDTLLARALVVSLLLIKLSAATVVPASAESQGRSSRTHNYPGRMSIHLVPFAVAALLCAVAPGVTRWVATAHFGRMF